MNGISVWRRLRRFFAGQSDPLSGLFPAHTACFHRAQLLVRAFYAFLGFIAISLIPEWNGVVYKGTPLLLWPVAWMQWFPLKTSVFVVLWIFLLGNLAGAFFAQLRWARLLAFLGLFQFWAYTNSFGKIGHSLHVPLLIALVFIFLPDGWSKSGPTTRLLRQKTLLVFWVGQGVAMMAYAMAGLIKVILGVYQAARGEPNVFLPDALARHVADRLQQTQVSSWLGATLIEHWWLGWPLMLGTLYLELFAWWALFRPRVQPFFALGLILFHVSSYWTMTILFPENCFLLALFFCGMPLLRGAWTWGGFFRDLPLGGDLWRWWQKRS